MSKESTKVNKNGCFYRFLLEASYLLAFAIAKQKKPHTIGKTLTTPCILKTTGIVLGKEAEKKLVAISLSNNTIQRQIKDLSLDIKSQVVQEIKTAPFGLFAIQLDESTDISSCAQLRVYARYVCNNAFKEEFLFCSTLETTTKAADILNKVTFFITEGLEWKNFAGCCTDGAPAMLAYNLGFYASVKRQAPKSKDVHCMLHRQTLASKTLPKSLQKVLEQIIKIVNFIKARALNSHLFKGFCADMDLDHQVLLYYTPTQWLSKGNVMRRVF